MVVVVVGGEAQLLAVGVSEFRAGDFCAFPDFRVVPFLALVHTPPDFLALFSAARADEWPVASRVPALDVLGTYALLHLSHG